MCNRPAVLASFVVALGIIPGSTVADPNPVCRWKFDGNANDSSGYSRNGTENGGPTYASGYDGQAIVLDGGTKGSGSVISLEAEFAGSSMK